MGLVEGCGEEVEDSGVGYYLWGLLGKGEVGRRGGDQDGGFAEGGEEGEEPGFCLGGGGGVKGAAEGADAVAVGEEGFHYCVGVVEKVDVASLVPFDVVDVALNKVSIGLVIGECEGGIPSLTILSIL